MTAVEWLKDELKSSANKVIIQGDSELIESLFEQAKELEKEQKINLLKSFLYSVSMGDDVEDVEEWLQKHKLNK